ncbi:hypothetical protein GGI07_002459 [Coemansia sp. Benny D115]|nr:hypothetical protein GGI07_002459 [Coemansia sp. Benny D115]
MNHPSDNTLAPQTHLRRRACTSTAATSDAAFLSPPLVDLAESPATGRERAWAVVPRKLRGLHPMPAIIYVRENPALVTHAMDKLYASLVTTYGVDTRDIRVTDVPTAYDLPVAVRRLGRDKHVVVVVGLLARNTLWFDQAQVDRVRECLLGWSQSTGVPLIDGLLIGDSPASLHGCIALPQWNIVAQNNIACMPDAEEEDNSNSNRNDNDDGSSRGSDADGSLPGYMFGHYLAHRAMEMFYFEHRGW